MYTLKSIARRGTSFAAAMALVVSSVGSAVLPAMSAYADALNPLTNRSLTLSSGSPGWAFTDGSGNATYAPPNSGANGQKTGNTFDFRTSSSATVKGFSFQYCTASAGDCMGPGDISTCSSGTTGGNDCVRDTNAARVAAKESDLEIVTSSPTQATFATYVTDTSTVTNPDGVVSSVPAPATSGANFLVYYLNGTTWTASPVTWTMTASQKQPGSQSNGTATGKNNYISLTNSTGQSIPANTRVKVVFFGTDANYITNPGSKEFFVKINTWNTDTPGTWTPGNAENIDGGVTVANVMNESIQITTKVLETMDFSVGTVDPYTLQALQDQGGNEDETSQLYLSDLGNVKHGGCDRILGRIGTTGPKNTLSMGDIGAENSLRTDTTYSTHSYWRLSSNSSAGATVYYSGVTLSNTVGDKINAIGGAATAPQVGSEQFGLAIANATTGYVDTTPADGFDDDGVAYPVSYASEKSPGKVFEQAADDLANGLATYGSQGIDASVTDANVSNLPTANASWHSPQLYPLAAGANYDGGVGSNNNTSPYGAITTSYAFDEASNTVPVPIATESNQVVDCVTGKMRYIANIAATTPAGIYTTKINYIAAPQY